MAGFEAVVDALAIEWVDAAGGVADEHPVRAGNPAHGTAHGQERRPRCPDVAFELPLLALVIGVVLHKAAQVHLGGMTAGGERAHADVHLAVAEREDPAVAGEEFAVLPAQFEVGGDPWVVASVALDVAAGGHAVDGAAVPHTSEFSSQLGFRAIGHDEALAADLALLSLARRKGDRGDLRGVERDGDGAVALDRGRARIDRDLPDGCIEFEPGRCPAMAWQ